MWIGKFGDEKDGHVTGVATRPNHCLPMRLATDFDRHRRCINPVDAKDWKTTKVQLSGSLEYPFTKTIPETLLVSLFLQKILQARAAYAPIPKPARTNLSPPTCSITAWISSPICRAHSPGAAGDMPCPRISTATTLKIKKKHRRQAGLAVSTCGLHQNGTGPSGPNAYMPMQRRAHKKRGKGRGGEREGKGKREKGKGKGKGS